MTDLEIANMGAKFVITDYHRTPTSCNLLILFIHTAARCDARVEIKNYIRTYEYSYRNKIDAMKQWSAVTMPNISMTARTSNDLVTFDNMSPRKVVLFVVQYEQID